MNIDTALQLAFAMVAIVAGLSIRRERQCDVAESVHRGAQKRLEETHV